MSINFSLFINRSAIVAGAVILGNVATCFAKELVIADCSGAPRLVKEVEDKLQAISLTVTDKSGQALDGVKVVLTNQDTAVKSESTSDEGKVAFTNVTAGSWRFCPANSEAIVSNVSLSNASGFGSTTAIGTGLLASAGIVGAIVGSSNDSSSSSSSLNTTSGAGSVSPAVPAPALGDSASRDQLGSEGSTSNFNPGPPYDEQNDPVSPS